MKYSLLDLAPVPEGHTAGEAIANSIALGVHAEKLGYNRHWMAEHHNMPGIASSATAVLIGHVAAATSRIRVGSGGIMLPNHSPLTIAEQFGTLATIYPGRIDLGLGRAPGTDMETARALRRHMSQQDTFPQDVMELMAYLGDPQDGQRVHAVPGEGTHVPLWILGSSLYGAQLAAHLGLPYSFASHFAPQMLSQAAEVYRRYFKPSEVLDQPYFMMAMNVYGGETDAEGEYLRSSNQLQFARLRTGNPGKLPRPVENIADHVPAHILQNVNEAGAISAAGSPAKVHREIAALIETFQPDEVIINCQIHSHEKRLRSYEIAAGALQELGAEMAA